MGGEYFELLRATPAGKKVFADLKFYDVPATVRGAVANLALSGAYCCTLHGVSSIYRRAVPAKGEMKLFAVTVLTSFDAKDVAELGWTGPVEEFVSLRAQRAIAGNRWLHLLGTGSGAFAQRTRSAVDHHAWNSRRKRTRDR